MRVEPEVEAVVTSIVDRVALGRRVSFHADTKTEDGICNPRDRLLVTWFKTCVKNQWVISYDYSSLNEKETSWLKEDTEDIFTRIYKHPMERIPLLPNGAGGYVINTYYLVNFIAQEINYFHTNY